MAFLLVKVAKKKRPRGSLVFTSVHGVVSVNA